MQNHFRIKQNTSRSQSDAALQKRLFPDKPSEQEQKARVAMTRASIWAKRNLCDENTLQILKNGMIPLTQDIEYKAMTSRGDKKNIYLRHYEPGKDRAETERKEYMSGHLEQTPYIPKRELVRERVIDKELAHSIRYGLRTQNQRLTEYLDGPNRVIDATASDTRMLTEPCWKDVDKSKWKSERNFDTTSCLYRGRKCQDQWEMIKGAINNGDSYVEGFETVGDLSRRRIRPLEIAPRDFLTTVTPNHSTIPRLAPLESTSVRSYHVKKFFDDNQNAKLYPKTLKHVMNTVPTEEDDGLSSTPSLMPKVIHIKTGRLETLKESFMASPATSKPRASASLKTMKAGISPLMSASGLERTKTSTLKRAHHIKEIVNTYFDN